MLLQGYPDLEYIIVDGGSSDESVSIIDKYHRHLTWWVSEPDDGQSQAINKGFARAGGAIYAYLNSDDYYLPGALHTCAREYRQRHPWIVGQVEYFQQGIGHWPVPMGEEKTFAEWFITCPLSQPGCFWSAALYHELGAFREDLDYFFDYEFWLRLRFVKGQRPYISEQTFAVYRIHPDSKTVAQTAAFAEEGKPIRAHYRSYLSHPQRVWLWIVRRHRKARIQGARAVGLIKERRFGAALGQLVVMLRTWPLMVVDYGVVLAIKELLAGKPQTPAPPQIFPEWDD